MFRAATLIFVAMALLVGPAKADDIRRERVRFQPNAREAVLAGRITGYDSVEYSVNARGGQTISVRLQTDNGMAFFNVLSARTGQTLFVGQNEAAGRSFRGRLPIDGDYVVQVYLVRAAARRNETARYLLRIGIDGGIAPLIKPQNDFADSLMGGPDFWIVTGVPLGDALNLRRGPSASEAIITTLANGTVLRNTGCQIAKGQRWCRVERPRNASVRGWVLGRYLREYGGTPN